MKRTLEGRLRGGEGECASFLASSVINKILREPLPASNNRIYYNTELNSIVLNLHTEFTILLMFVQTSYGFGIKKD